VKYAGLSERCYPAWSHVPARTACVGAVFAGDWTAERPACIFHEGGTVCHVIAKRINLIRRLLGIVSQGQFLPIHFQENCAVTV
jgi:hypothetical protein